eukprot:scaffold332_cov117-Cylindrotheca_fusiformis.AAC.20
MSRRELLQGVIDLESSSDEDDLLPLKTFTSTRNREESGSNKTKNVIRREKKKSSSVVNVCDQLLPERKADLNQPIGHKVETVVAEVHYPGPQMKVDTKIDEPRDRTLRRVEKETDSASKEADDESEDEDNETCKNHRSPSTTSEEREWGACSSSSSIEFGSPLCYEEDASIDESAVKVTQSQSPESFSSNPTSAEPSPDAEESDATIDLEKEDSTDKGRVAADGSASTEYDTPVATKRRGRKRDSSSVDTRELLRKANARTKDFQSSHKEESIECSGAGKEVPANEEKKVGLETSSLRATRQRGSVPDNCVSRSRKSARVNSIEVVWTTEKKEAYKRKYPCLEKGRPMKRGHLSRFCTACECCISCIIPPWCPQRQHHSLKIISSVEGDNGLDGKAHDEKGSKSSKPHRQGQAKQEPSKKRKRTVSKTAVKKTRLAPVKIETNSSSKKSLGPRENLNDLDAEHSSKKKPPGPREDINDSDRDGRSLKSHQGTSPSSSKKESHEMRML